MKVSIIILSLLWFSLCYGQHSIVLEGATLIDGTGNPPLSNSVIVIQGTRIIAVGEQGKIETPKDAKKINVRGKYIMPGLIDCHIHYGEPRDLVQLLAWGVTSANCMFESTDQALEMEKRTASDTIHSPQIYATAPIFTCEHGWWWGEGFPIDSTINRFPKTPDEAREQVRKVKAKGIKRIKIMYDDMGWCRDSLPRLSKMDKDIMKELYDEAERDGMLTEVHVPQLADAQEVLKSGYPHLMFRGVGVAFAHGIIDDTISVRISSRYHLTWLAMPGVLMGFLGKDIYYVPTFCVFEFLADVRAFMRNALSDERFRFALNDEVVEKYTSKSYYDHYDKTYPNSQFVREHLSILNLNLKKLKESRYVAMGTDMWAFPGIGAHLELQYMVNAGMTPMQAIVSSTQTGGLFLTAPKFGEELFEQTNSPMGTIAKDKIADLLILDANPLEDIRNTRTVRTIIKHGIIFDHQQLVEESKR